MNIVRSLSDYAYIRPIDVAKLVKEYRRNRVETINIAKKIWYDEREKIHPAYRTKLKLFVQDLQLVLNLSDERNIEGISMEIQETTGKDMEVLLDFPPDYKPLAEFVQYWKNIRLILLYFPGAYIPKLRYSSIFKNVKKQYPKDMIVNRTKECLRLYSLEIVGPRGKLIDVDFTPLDYKSFVSYKLFSKQVSVGDELDSYVDLRSLEKYCNNDFSNLNKKDFWMLYR